MRYSIASDKHGGLWTARFMVTNTDCPHLQTAAKKRFHDRIILEKGEKSSFVRSMIYGEFSSSEDENKLFMEYDLEAVRRAMKFIGDVLPGRVRAGFDLSTTGEGDPKVIYVVRGTEVLPAHVSREEDTTRVAEWAVEILKDAGVKPQDCYIDNGGAGKPIVDYIERLGYKPVVRYMNNHGAKYSAEYADRVTEDAYAIKALFHSLPIKLPFDMELYEDIRTRRVVLMDHEKLKLQKKTDHRKEYGKSPDRLDALIMALADFRRPPVKTIARRDDGEREILRRKFEAAAQESRGRMFGGMMKQSGMKELSRELRFPR